MLETHLAKQDANDDSDTCRTANRGKKTAINVVVHLLKFSLLNFGILHFFTALSPISPPKPCSNNLHYIGNSNSMTSEKIDSRWWTCLRPPDGHEAVASSVGVLQRRTLPLISASSQPEQTHVKTAPEQSITLPAPETIEQTQL